MPEIQLEAGKFYRTRDGRKAYVLGQNPFLGDDERFLGFVEKAGGSSYRFAWAGNGRRANHATFGSDTDLVDIWREPLERYCVVEVQNGVDYAITNYLNRPSESRIPDGARVIKWREVSE